MSTTTSPAWTAGARAVSDGGEKRRLRSLLLFGVLFGVTNIALIVPSILVRGGGIDQLLVAPAHVAITWLPIGIGIAFAVFRLTKDPTRWRRLLVAMPLVAFVCALYATAVFGLERLLLQPGDIDWPSWRHALLTLGVYTAWLTLAYGSGAAALHSLQRRVDHTTDSLANAIVARDRNATALADAQVRALVERIEPGFLLDVMTAARERYRSAPAEAEAILEACVTFLRNAIPQMRSGVSTVRAEIDLAAAYLALRSRLDAHPRRWRIERAIDARADARVTELPMPPMALIPLLDTLLRACADRVEAEAIVIALAIDVDALALSVGVPSSDDGDGALDPVWLDALDRRVAWFGGRVCRLGEASDGHSAGLGVRIVFPLRDRPR